MTIEEEIARAMRYAIRPDVPVHLPVPRMYEDMTAALAPILNRVRAEARLQGMRTALSALGLIEQNSEGRND